MTLNDVTVTDQQGPVPARITVGETPSGTGQKKTTAAASMAAVAIRRDTDISEPQERKGADES